MSHFWATLYGQDDLEPAKIYVVQRLFRSKVIIRASDKHTLTALPGSLELSLSRDDATQQGHSQEIDGGTVRCTVLLLEAVVERPNSTTVYNYFTYIHITPHSFFACKILSFNNGFQ